MEKVNDTTWVLPGLPSGFPVPESGETREINTTAQGKEVEMWRHTNPDGTVVAGDETGDVWDANEGDPDLVDKVEVAPGIWMDAAIVGVLSGGMFDLTGDDVDGTTNDGDIQTGDPLSEEFLDPGETDLSLGDGEFGDGDGTEGTGDGDGGDGDGDGEGRGKGDGNGGFNLGGPISPQGLFAIEDFDRTKLTPSQYAVLGPFIDMLAGLR